jgi:uncharacterized protein
MRKRVRKKLRLGEFRQFGFELGFALAPSATAAELDQFWDRFILGFVEIQGLVCGGACGRVWSVFIAPHGRRSATESDRAAARAWLAEQPGVGGVNVGPLIDAWHSA